MPAVADSGPLIHLAQVGQIGLLKEIFEEVFVVLEVKREVVDEGISGGYPDARLVADAFAEGYIVVRRLGSRFSGQASKLAKREKISESDSETLLLAKSLQRPLLTDEKVLSMLARMYGLEVWNTWTVLLEALRTRLIDKQRIHAAISELGEGRHKLSPRHTKQVLAAVERIEASKES